MSITNYGSSKKGKDLILLLCESPLPESDLIDIFSEIVGHKHAERIKAHPLSKQNVKYALSEPLGELVNAAVWKIADYRAEDLDDAYDEIYRYFTDSLL